MDSIFFELTHASLPILFISNSLCYIRIRVARDKFTEKPKRSIYVSKYSLHYIPMFEKINNTEPDHIKKLVFIRNIIVLAFWLNLLLIFITHVII